MSEYEKKKGSESMLNEYLSELVDYSEGKGLIKSEDRIYCANRVLAVVGGESFEYTNYEKHSNIEEILNGVLDCAAENGKLEDNTITYRDLLSAEIMACFTKMPSEIICKFKKNYEISPKDATDWFYNFSKSTNYIMTERVKKNIIWKTNTEKYGDIDLTINLSKPEKDPKEIAKAKTVKQNSYPKCLLCKENEGFKGTFSHPGRGNHRIIPLTLGEKDWYMQYSPYVYYNEHCIVFNSEHTPMVISRDTFVRLLDFVEMFPHYFLGSNADLPIVGGSILTHDHYQGGNYEFPMAKCKVKRALKFRDFDDVEAGIVNWALSTIRLKSKNKDSLVNLADKILNKWREYDDEDCEILSHTDAPHNTITPIARMRDGYFELDLILRNNRTSKEHPLGIFHPHSEYHHIKKENIGLIEAMGLAVLPPRLTTQFGELNSDIKEEIGQTFLKILENCGVFKNSDFGEAHFIRFADAVDNG